MTLAVLTLIILVVVWYTNLPGHRTLGQRIDDLVRTAPHAASHTADKLTSPETAAKANQAADKVDATLKKTGDAASTAAAEIGNDIKAAVNEQKKQNAIHKPDKALAASASSGGANDQQ
jgi:hypothetical protein